MAAMNALRPVRGSVGSKLVTAAPAEADEEEALEPPPLDEGLLLGLAFPTTQVSTPLMTPFDRAALN
jgi:hypothetical protein